MTTIYEALLGKTQPTRRRIFISYHHHGDQYYYDYFSTIFHNEFETIFDYSVDRKIDSDCTEYIMRRIREDFITQTSCTIVLCGAETPWRKYVDWEIKATLDKKHGLIGIQLPSAQIDATGKWYAPDRLVDNVSSGYASIAVWNGLLTIGPYGLYQLLNSSNEKPKALIVNNRPMMTRNGVSPWQR